MDENAVFWFSGIEGLDTAAKSRGIEIETGAEVVSVRQTELLASPAVKKALRVDFPGVECMSFSELWDYQYEEIKDFLNKYSLELDEDYLENLDNRFSQIVYDEKDRIRAMLLCKASNEEILVELLIGATKASEYILTVLRGFMRVVEKESTERQIVMLAVSDNVLPLLKRLLDKRYTFSRLGEVHSAQNRIDDKFAEMIKEAEESCFYQKNIQWKCSWAKQVHSGFEK